MGLFHRNEKEANFAGGSKNVMESIQREHDTNTLIYLDPREDFNTNSVITVAPNEQVIFIKNGELYGVLPSGRHEVKTENYPVLSRIRNMLTGGISTFTCQVYHVSTAEQNVLWGTPKAFSFPDHFLGASRMGIKTNVTAAGSFRVCFNIREDDNASVQAFMRIMGDKSSFTVNDLSRFIGDQLTSKITTLISKTFKNLSLTESINGIDDHKEEVSQILTKDFEPLFAEYGFNLVNFSFRSISIEDDENRRMFLERVNAAELNMNFGGYGQAFQQEILKDIAVNPNAGGLANAGAGLGMGIAAGTTFGSIVSNAFTQPQQMPQQNSAPIQQKSDPMEVLGKLKKMLDAGLISQEKYDAKVDEIMNDL